MTTEPAVVSFVRNAPRKMPGHTRGPKTSTAARAMPVGGQTAVALALTNASARPSLPASVYIAASGIQTLERRLSILIGIPISGFQHNACGSRRHQLWQ